MPFTVNLRTVQDLCYRIIEKVYPELQHMAYQGDEHSGQWIDYMNALSEKLWIKIDPGLLES